MAGTLYLVATPIGNLEDITLRALRILKSASLIAAEDTRRTAKLLSHFGISTQMVSLHAHNTRSRLPQILQTLEQGADVALVTDAGTPVVSDPGLEVVQSCVREGICVDAIPGASAPMTLAALAGFPLAPWTIHGFPPSRSKDRKIWLLTVCSDPNTLTFFEAPHRILRTITEIAALCGERPIVVGRELTKVHQTVYRGSAKELLAAGLEERGEFTVMLGPLSAPLPTTSSVTDETILHDFGLITEHTSSSRRGALKAVAEKHGISPKQVYAAIERAKCSG